MAFDPVVRGLTWSGKIRVHPTDGEENSDVVTFLTGASVTLRLNDPSTGAQATSQAGTVDAANRLLHFELDGAATSALILDQYRAACRVTTSGGANYAVAPALDPSEALIDVEDE